MQVISYDGYFSKGNFYALGKMVRIPEQQRVIITILNEEKNSELKNEKKQKILRNLRGSCKDASMIEPNDISLEHSLPRRYDLVWK